MEIRIARLEADTDYVKLALHKLSDLPTELARISERLNQMPTRYEMCEAIEAAVDRSGARVQLTIAIAGAMITIVSGIVTYLVKIAG